MPLVRMRQIHILSFLHFKSYGRSVPWFLETAIGQLTVHVYPTGVWSLSISGETLELLGLYCIRKQTLTSGRKDVLNVRMDNPVGFFIPALNTFRFIVFTSVLISLVFRKVEIYRSPPSAMLHACHKYSFPVVSPEGGIVQQVTFRYIYQSGNVKTIIAFGNSVWFKAAEGTVSVFQAFTCIYGFLFSVRNEVSPSTL